MTDTNDVAVTADVVGPKPHTKRLPGQVVKCGWCGNWVAVPSRGRVPKWCSTTCRHRAWEQRRAAASGLAAVEVVDRVIQLEAPPPPPPPEPEPREPVTPRTVDDWVQQLDHLARALDTGRIYVRDLPQLRTAIEGVMDAYDRRARRR